MKITASRFDDKNKSPFNNKLCSQEDSEIMRKIRPKILIIEDNYKIQMVMSQQLDQLGCEFDIADDGESALRLVKNTKYDLIALDVGLPDMTGIEVCEVIRSNGLNIDTPIIVITAFGEVLYKKCINVGANDYFIKPIMPNELQNIIKIYIPWHKAPNSH